MYLDRNGKAVRLPSNFRGRRALSAMTWATAVHYVVGQVGTSVSEEDATSIFWAEEKSTLSPG